MKLKIKKIISSFIIVLSFTILAITLYIRDIFGNAKFEQLIYSLLYAEGTSNDVVLNALKYCVPIIIFLSIIFIFMIVKDSSKITKIKIIIRNKNYSFKIFPIKNKLIYSTILLIVILSYSSHSIGLFEYIKNQTIKTTIYEKYYINPETTKLEFPENRRNLIYIYLESMETGYNKIIIDDKETNTIPNLESIATNNINFSNTDEFGGASSIYGTTWTIAGTIAQTAGIPLKLDIIGSNEYDHYNSFLPGVTSIGDILDKAGYNQVYMIGSDSGFAGRYEYFTEHGRYDIKDYWWARNEKKIDPDYFEFWGYEDKKLFEYAKEELLELASKEEPFNFTMLTVDTHAIDGYLDESCEEKYSYKYANAISCSDSMIAEFIKWLEKQDFYKDTTIILTGDHLTMQSDITEFLVNNDRSIYNVIINAAMEANDTKKRIFTSLDMFPTTLASLGVKIEGERLGLGTNLFSNEKTLAEELSLEVLDEELKKKSDYYNLSFLKDTYFEMIKEEQEKQYKEKK